MLIRLLGQLSVPRTGPGRPRNRPASLAADKAYSSKAIRAHLRGRRITAVIPEPADQIGHRRRRGSTGGRPVEFDAVAYHRRNVIERAFNQLTHRRGIATRYDKHATTYRGAVVLAAILTWLQQGDTP
jgi:transposase